MKLPLEIEIDGPVTPPTEPRYRAWPAQLIRHNDGVLLRRGMRRLFIAGAGAHEVLAQVLAAATDERGASQDELLQGFRQELRGKVQDLLTQLISKSFLSDSQRMTAGPEAETPDEIFYWDIGASKAQALAAMNEQTLVVVGVNHVSRQLVQTLSLSGQTRLVVADHHELRNQHMFGADGQLLQNQWQINETQPVPFERWVAEENDFGVLVATSDFGGLSAMREWNEYCVRQNKLFLPLVLQDTVGHVGPLVVPGETACFECAWLRQSANMNQPDLERASDAGAFAGQAVNGWLPAMASVLGNLGAMELQRFTSKVLPGFRSSVLTEVDLLGPTLNTRRLLKVPRCRVCGPLIQQAMPTTFRNEFLPGNEEARA